MQHPDSELRDPQLLSLAKVLREAHTGERLASGLTRARVLETMQRRRRQRVVRWLWLGPLLTLGLGGSVWAQASGRLDPLWQAASQAIERVSGRPSRAPARVARPPMILPSAPPAATPELPALVPSVDAGSFESAAPGAESWVEPEVVTEPERPKRAASRRPASARLARPPMTEGESRAEPDPKKPAQEPPPEAAPDPELRLFRTAHELHLKGNAAQAALDAYDRYLERYPSGRFVPEARYNRALNLVKLGEKVRAREALKPFAEGQFGPLRQAPARQLLNALER
jgi:hypothetical protein